MIAILAAVFNHTPPGFTGFYGLPEILEGARWHVRMPYQVVGLADQFVHCVAGHFGELFIGGGDLAAKVGGGDQVIVVRVSPFFLADGFVDSHEVFLPRYRFLSR